MDTDKLRKICKARGIKKTTKGVLVKKARKPTLIVTLEKYDLDNQ